MIRLVEVIWKLLTIILHRRLTTGIKLHDVLHRLREGRGTGTATLEAKLLQQLAAMREEVLYVIFLDLTKAYDALDRSRSLEILKGYGVGERVQRLLAVYWERTKVVARAGSYYGKGFKGERGVTQGDPLSPTIFNLVVDAVVRHWLQIATQEAEIRESTEMAFEAYGEQLESVPRITYLGRVMMAGDDDCTAVAGNLMRMGQ